MLNNEKVYIINLITLYFFNKITQLLEFLN